MKTGVVLKSKGIAVTDNDMALINKYTRRELTHDEVYVFSVVLCDNDIDRDYERFTVESLFELEKLFVGKSGIFDHNPSAFNQTARVYECKVESVEGQKTATGDDYFRLVAKAYIPKSEKNNDLILNLDSGIIKEVSVGCAVKETLCSICSKDMSYGKCSHTKGMKYGNKLCFGELVSPYDAYEFSFVAVPAQKNAGVIKTYAHNKEENKKMTDILNILKKGKEITLKSYQVKSLKDYIAELEERAENGDMYKEHLNKSVKKHMALAQPFINTKAIDSIVDKLSVSELEALKEGFEKKNAQSYSVSPQLFCDNKGCAKNENTSKNNQFTI